MSPLVPPSLCREFCVSIWWLPPESYHKLSDLSTTSLLSYGPVGQKSNMGLNGWPRSFLEAQERDHCVLPSASRRPCISWLVDFFFPLTDSGIASVYRFSGAIPPSLTTVRKGSPVLSSYVVRLCPLRLIPQNLPISRPSAKSHLQSPIIHARWHSHRF